MPVCPLFLRNLESRKKLAGKIFGDKNFAKFHESRLEKTDQIKKSFKSKTQIFISVKGIKTTANFYQLSSLPFVL